MGSTSLQRLILAPETTAGTPATTGFTTWRGMGQLQDDRVIGDIKEKVGVVLPGLRTFVAQHGSSLAMESVPASFEQLYHILQAGVSAASNSTDGSGSVDAYSYGTTTPAALKTYTLVAGDDTDLWQADYGFVESFNISATKGEPVMMDATWRGRNFDDRGSYPTTTVPTVSTIIANLGQFFIDAPSGTIGTTAITGTIHSWALSVTTGWKAYWTIDDNNLEFNNLTFSADDFNAELSIVFEHNATATAQKAIFDAAGNRIFRLEMEGDALGTPGVTYSNELLRVDFAGFYNSWSALGDNNGNSVIEAGIRIGYDATADLALAFTTVYDTT